MEFLELMESIHSDLSKIDYDKLDTFENPIKHFRHEISNINFTGCKFDFVISKLTKFGYHMDKTFKENKYLVVLSAYLTSMERSSGINVNEPKDYIDPLEYDVLLSDVKHNDLIGPISERLEVEYLESLQNFEKSQKNLQGILYGSNCRPMVNLVIASKKFKKHINIIFLVDTVSPYPYICEKAMENLGYDEYVEHIPSTFSILFENKTHEAVMSPLFRGVESESNGTQKKGQYHDLNLLGALFYSKAGAKLEIDYAQNSFSLTFQ